MYVYLATGTSDFMEMLQKKYKKENMTVLYGGQQSLLMHITDGKTKFATPQSFEVVKSVNEFQEHGFYTITYIDVFIDTLTSFEGRMQAKNFHFVQEPGFVAYKLLKPTKSSVFAIIQQWSGANSYEAWKMSAQYKTDFDFMVDDSHLDRQTMASVEPYTKMYSTAPVEEEIEEDNNL